MAPALSTDQLGTLIGHVLGPSSWITVDQPRIDEFARCTGDQQWIHVDVERAAREAPGGSTIAHGYLTLALLAASTSEVLMPRVQARQALNYGLDKVRFLAPVRAGRRVRVHVEVMTVQDKGEGRVLLTLDNNVEIEGEDKPALIGSTLVMLVS
jgi:acyl dehydratase